MEKKALVEIRPIEKKKWHGKDGKESFTQPITIRVLYDHATGAYATGLTDKETEEYQAKLGVDLTKVFNAQKAHAYWDSNASRIKLPNYPIFLDPTIPLEFVRIKNLKASNLVANSMKEYNNGLYPEASHVIFDDEEYVEIKATDLPQEVQTALSKDFEGATLNKAYINSKNEYKLTLTTAEDTEATVYATAEGEWIKKK